MTSPALVALWAALALSLALFLCKPEWHGLFANVPEETKLTRAEGTLTAFRQHTNEEGLRFQLSGSESYFVLSQYSGAEPAVRRSPPGAKFTVLFDPRQQSAPVWSNRRSFIAYVVYVDGSAVKPYRQVVTDAYRDIAWAPWIGGLLGFAGLGLAGWALKLRFWRNKATPSPQKAG